MREAVILVLISLLQLASTKKGKIDNTICGVCHFLVATFDAGLKKTAGQHFAGGDTAWEEKNLGKYATSETRLIEVMEGVCKKKILENTDRFNHIDNLEFKCSSLVESQEELVEEYYSQHQSRNMSEWLCIEQLKYCCKEGHYGPACQSCPGLTQSFSACSGRGKCHGDGSRQGSGKCECSEGYQGESCSECSRSHFQANSDEFLCLKCHQSCAQGCKDATPGTCVACKPGWVKNNGICEDVDECAQETACTRDNEVCSNTEGSFTCNCKEGYKKVADGCELDIEASPPYWLLPPDQLLRMISHVSLVGIITIVVWRRSIFLTVLTTIAVILMIFIDMNVNSNTIPDEAKRILGQ